MSEIFALIAAHWDLIELVITAIRDGKVSKEAATKAITDAMVVASDLEMHRELDA